jgi:hypothetical protein
MASRGPQAWTSPCLLLQRLTPQWPCVFPAFGLWLAPQGPPGLELGREGEGFSEVLGCKI